MRIAFLSSQSELAQRQERITTLFRQTHWRAENVARFVLNLTRLAPDSAASRIVELNGAPGVIVYVDGEPYTTLSFDVVGEQITAVYAVVNPEKLGGSRRWTGGPCRPHIFPNDRSIVLRC